jgi:serine/threonine protein kinase
MAATLACPDHETILRSLAGGTPEEVERIATHLEGCAGCGAALDSLLQDHETAVALRDPRAATEVGGEALQGLNARLARLLPIAGMAFRGGEESESSSCPQGLPAGATFSFLRPPQQADEIGRLGTYRILKKLGAGGMGVVFLAEDTLLGRKVALKTMLPALAENPQNKARFLREARIAAAIENPHIVTIFQVGEDNGVPYLAMPLLKGVSLHDRLARSRKLPAGEALRIAGQMAEGLVAAHAEGLIHRDIKPGNVWLEGGAAAVILLDFGLARAQADDTHLTQSGAIVGTPAFMAPEQARGLAVDGRADLYSLGCVLYVMLTGERPFRGNTMSLLSALALDTPKSPHELDPEVPADASDFLMRLLAKRPDERPASAAEVVEALARLASSAGRDDLAPTEQFPAPPEAKPAAPPMPPKRRRRSLAVVGLLLALVGAGVVNGGTIYRLVSNVGGLVVEVDDEEVLVKVLRGGVVVHDKTSKRKFTLTAGEGEIEVVERDGIKLTTKKFELTRNGKTTVKVTMRELAEARKRRDDPEYKAADYVLGIGGSVRVLVKDKEVAIEPGTALPTEPFRLTYIVLLGNRKVDDAGLANLAGCKHLVHLKLDATNVGDDGMAHLKGLETLTNLGLGGTRVTSRGLVCFADFKDLTYLDLFKTEVGDEGLAHFKRSKNLHWVQLGNTELSDEGLSHFADCKRLKAIALEGTKVGDAGLVHLARCKELEKVELKGTTVTRAGVVELQKALPECKIEWDGSEPKGK